MHRRLDLQDGQNDDLRPVVRVYISGPMTGIPEYNRAAFLAAEARLRALGLEPVNPWDFGEVPGWG
ncbi:MAG: DUF4406 domain-containing protein, partial [Candidatus Methylomirabilota bacterium]